MSTITLPNIRVGSDLQVRVRLKDGGVAIDWSTLQNIKACIYSDAQRALAGRCSISIDAEDPTLLVCNYAANKPQYLGANRVVISVKYLGETKTYDKPAFTFVRWTDDQAGEQITIDDPDVDVEIEVEDISSSILQEAVDAAFAGAERANEAAAAAEHMVDIHTGPEGKSAYEVAVEEGYTGTEEEWLASLVGPQGPQGIQGETGEAAGFGTASAALTEDGGNPGVTVATSGSDTAKNFAFTFKNLKGEKGDKGDQGNTGSSVDYPFELVNNETTDDATKAHTAAGAKRLKDEVSQLEAKVDGYESETKSAKDVSSITNVGRYIANNNTWAAGSSAQGKFIPVTPGKKYGVKFISTYNGEGSNVTFTTTNDATTGNSVSYATGFTREYCAEGTEYSFIAPSDAAYFWVLVRKGSSTYFTYEVYEYSSEHIEGLEENVSDLQNDVSSLDSSVVQLQQDVNIKMDKVIEEDLTDTADYATDKYIQYSSGKVANPSSDALYKMFYFKVDDAYSVRCYLGLDGTTPAAIAFYSSQDFDPTNQFPSGTGESDGQGGYRDAYYMQSDSIAGENKTGWFEATVPSGAIWCAVSNRGATLANPVIKRYKEIDLVGYIEKTDQKFDSMDWVSLRNYFELGGMTINLDSWVYGPSTSRARTRNGVTIPLRKGDIIRCADSGLVYYLGWRVGSTYSRQGWISGDFVVPNNAEFVILSRYSTEATITDLDRFLDAFLVHSPTFFNNKAGGLIVKREHINPFKHKKNYGHLFIDQITKEIAYAIPCQSILDVDITARLGFDVMEGNVHATATSGKYVVIHGQQGKLSKDVTDLNGETVTNVSIAGTSFSDLMNDYVYRSKYAKNRIHISSLEEFLYACVRNNITPLVTYVDHTEVGIIKDICGDNFILYDNNGVSRHFYDGMIFSWNTDETVDEIINSAKSIGAPLMIGINAALTDSEYRQIIDAVHEMGGLVGIAGCYLTGGETARRMGLGFDFNGSNRECNDIRGNLISLDNRVGTDWLDLTYASVDSENTITINAGSNISVRASELKTAPIMKGRLKIRYSGKLSIYMMGGGSLTDEPVSSNGEQFVEWSAYYVQGNKNNNFNYMPEVYISAVDDTTMIYEIEYKVDSV